MIRCGIIISSEMGISLLNANKKYEASTVSSEDIRFYPALDAGSFKNKFAGGRTMPDRLHKTISWGRT